MNLIINHSSMEPIYEQLSRQFRTLISTRADERRRAASFGACSGQRVKDQRIDGQKSL